MPFVMDVWSWGVVVAVVLLLAALVWYQIAQRSKKRRANTAPTALFTERSNRPTRVDVDYDRNPQSSRSSEHYGLPSSGTTYSHDDAEARERRRRDAEQAAQRRRRNASRRPASTNRSAGSGDTSITGSPLIESFNHSHYGSNEDRHTSSSYGSSYDSGSSGSSFGGDSGGGGGGGSD